MAHSAYKNPTYFVVGHNPQVANMMSLYGYDRVTDIKHAAVVVFTGGPDIHPMFYGQRMHSSVTAEYSRDLLDIHAYRSLNKDQIPIGICRGAQFLNVMAGNGKLYQHVDKHALGHKLHSAKVSVGLKNTVFDFKLDQVVQVTSTHHQMMIPGPSGDIWAYSQIATEKYGAGPAPVIKHKNLTDQMGDKDPEVVYYWSPSHESGCLCFQPHPEYVDDPACDETTRLLFYFLESGSLLGNDLRTTAENNRANRLPAFLAKRAERLELQKLHDKTV